MIVYDLKCSRAHVFEAWFGSSEDFAGQQDRGLVACPVCDDRAIEKAVMAPAVGPKGNRRTTDSHARAELARLAALQADVERNCDYVGRAFVEEARARFHEADERPARGIFGEATIAAALELVEEGIPVAPLPFRPRQAADA